MWASQLAHDKSLYDALCSVEDLPNVCERSISMQVGQGCTQPSRRTPRCYDYEAEILRLHYNRSLKHNIHTG
jgi:hypothetical protein